MHPAKEQQDFALSGSGMTSARARKRLVNEVALSGVRNPVVLAALDEVPRHIFIDSGIAHRAYENIALPIGWKQTISQPSTVARITELVLDFFLEYKATCRKVLEVGAGCGYQAAILATIFKEVHAVERVKPLYELARGHRKVLGLKNLHLHYQDGWAGLAKHAAYDAIVVSAATDEVPQELLAQLAEPGCLVLPLGPPRNQVLTRYNKLAGEVHPEKFDGVMFVPLLKGTQDAKA